MNKYNSLLKYAIVIIHIPIHNWQLHNNVYCMWNDCIIYDCKSSSCYYVITIFPRVSNLGYNYFNYYDGQRRLEIITTANNIFYVYVK